MSWIDGVRHRCRELLRPRQAADELDEELGDHFARELARQDERHADDAVRAARLRAGAPTVAAEAVRDGRTGRLAADLLRDVRFGLRGIRRSPGVALAVMISLALGIGGTTAVLTVVRAVMLRPLPYPDSERLFEVQVWWKDFSALPSNADLTALSEGPAAGRVGAYFVPDGGFAMATHDGPELIAGGFMTPGLLRVLGTAPLRGRGFSDDRDAREALISASLWHQRFDGSDAAIGKVITLDGEPFTIVGVMPPGFGLPGRRNEGAWVHARLEPSRRRGPFFLNTIVRVAANVSPAGAEAALTAAAVPFLHDRFGVTDRWRYGMRPLRDVVVGNTPETLWILSAAVGLVLLIAVANVANLLLARGTVRMREMSVRAAIGAARGRLVRQMLTETALLGLGGGAAGAVLAGVLVQVARTEAAPFIPRIDEVTVDVSLVTFAVALGMVAGMAAGVLPALRVPWTRLADALRAGGRTSGEDRHEGMARRVLVVAEIALAVAVVASAGLLVKSLQRLQDTDPGFRPGHVLSFQLALPDRPYSAPERVQAFVTDLERRLRGLPGTRNVAFAMALPPDLLQMSNNYAVEGRDVERPGSSGVAEWNVVSETYFATMGIRVIRGRTFGDADRADAPAVAVVNEAFVRRHYAGGNALGKRLKGGDWDPRAPWTTIVGIVADVPYERGAWSGPHPMVYTAYSQNWWLQSTYVVVGADGRLEALVPSIRRAVASLDGRVPLRDVAAMEDRLYRSAALPRLRGWIFSALGVLALTLSVTGIYGVTAFHVNRTRRETAIRRALGASSDQVVAATLATGLRLALAGVVVGTAGALAVTRSLSALLFQVDSRDPAIMGTTVLLLLGSAVLACAWPAVRAVRIDPATLLRDE